MSKPLQPIPFQPLGFSADEAAAFAGVSRGTFYKELYQLIRACQIKSYKIGRRRVIVIESFRTFLLNRADEQQ
jgi:hypothetical protein